MDVDASVVMRGALEGGHLFCLQEGRVVKVDGWVWVGHDGRRLEVVHIHDESAVMAVLRVGLAGTRS